MPKPQQTSGQNGLFSWIAIGLTPSDDRLILRLQAELSAEGQPEVTKRQVVRLAVRFAACKHDLELASCLRRETISAVATRALKRGSEKYVIRSFPVFSHDIAALIPLSKELRSAGLSHTRCDVIRGSLGSLLALSGRPELWRNVLALNEEIRSECALHDRRRGRKNE
jgi:hypothetical protein